MAMPLRSQQSTSPVASAPGDDLIPANRISGRDRQRLWENIQQHDANMRAFLQDPLVMKLVKEEGGVVLFPPALIEAELGRATMLELSSPS